MKLIAKRNRLATIRLDWTSGGSIFHLGRFSTNLSKKYKGSIHHVLSACELRRSKIRYAGIGIFLSEPAYLGQILTKYGGPRISFPEADRLDKLVRQC
jgi:hypothetical protein